MEIVNLFAFRATYPADLKLAREPVGRRNDHWIDKAYHSSDRVIACWGSDGSYLDRGNRIAQRYNNLYCLKLNKTRQPAHPLYLKANLAPTPLNAAQNAQAGMR